MVLAKNEVYQTSCKFGFTCHGCRKFIRKGFKVFLRQQGLICEACNRKVESGSRSPLREVAPQDVKPRPDDDGSHRGREEDEQELLSVTEAERRGGN